MFQFLEVLDDHHVSICILIVFKGILNDVEEYCFIQVPISYHLLLSNFDLLDQIKICASLKNEVLKRPNYIPNDWNHVSNGKWIDL